MPKFKPGDQVQLKSGGPQMTVKGQLHGQGHGDDIQCQWFSGHKLENGWFSEESLIPFVEGDQDSPKEAVTAKDVAAWMLAELERWECLYQHVAAAGIHDRFGDRFWYINQNGNLAIHKAVLDEFKALTKPRVVWDGSGRYWRWRNEYDPPDRRGTG